MADVSVNSDANNSMVDRPWFMQNLATAGSDITYTANEIRYLTRGMRATAPHGVGSGTDFKVTAGSGRSVNISKGLGCCFHSSNPEERYYVGSFGTVNIALPTYTSGTQFHKLFFQAIDSQIPAMGSTTRWRFFMKEGTGGTEPSDSAAAAASPLAVITDTGYTNISSSNIKDIRTPFDNTAPNVALTRNGTSTYPTGGSVGDRLPLIWTAQEDDPYDLWRADDADGSHIQIRHTGIYNIMLSVDMPGVDSSTAPAEFAECGVGIDGYAIGVNTIIAQDKRPGVTWGTGVKAVAMNQKLTAGHYLRCYSLANITVVQQDFKFKMQRVEYRP